MRPSYQGLTDVIELLVSKGAKTETKDSWADALEHFALRPHQGGRG